MTYQVEYNETKRESFGEYRYRIYKDGLFIANYWHDYRGDEHGIEFLNGTKELWPVGRMTEFLEGGGPQPLRLSKRAIDYLEQKQA